MPDNDSAPAGMSRFLIGKAGAGRRITVTALMLFVVAMWGFAVSLASGLTGPGSAGFKIMDYCALAVYIAMAAYLITLIFRLGAWLEVAGTLRSWANAHQKYPVHGAQS